MYRDKSYMGEEVNVDTYISHNIRKGKDTDMKKVFYAF